MSYEYNYQLWNMSFPRRGFQNTSNECRFRILQALWFAHISYQ